MANAECSTFLSFRNGGTAGAEGRWERWSAERNPLPIGVYRCEGWGFLIELHRSPIRNDRPHPAGRGAGKARPKQTVPHATHRYPTPYTVSIAANAASASSNFRRS